MRAGNQGIPIFAQLSTNPPTGEWDKEEGKVLRPVSVEEMAARVNAIRDLVEGAGFLLQAEGDGLNRFAEFLCRMRRP